ncbi:MAG: sterol desaturase family protein [Kofleriaceae bacterium]
MEALTRWSVLFVVDSLRYAIPASLAFAVLWIWKWDALAHRRIQPRRPSRKAFAREIRLSIGTAAIFATVGLGVFFLARNGVVEVYQDVDRYGWPYWIGSIVVAILLHDAYFYWTHRALHVSWLFRFHRAHHLSTSPSPWAAYAFGPVEALINALVVPVVVFVIPMHETAIFVFLIYMIAMNVTGHLGIELYPRWFARSAYTGWYSTSTHHNLHHRDFRGNYGLYFTWWDRLMGTEHERYRETFAAVTRSSAPRKCSSDLRTSAPAAINDSASAASSSSTS